MFIIMRMTRPQPVSAAKPPNLALYCLIPAQTMACLQGEAALLSVQSRPLGHDAPGPLQLGLLGQGVVAQVDGLGRSLGGVAAPGLTPQPLLRMFYIRWVTGEGQTVQPWWHDCTRSHTKTTPAQCDWTDASHATGQSALVEIQLLFGCSCLRQRAGTW